VRNVANAVQDSQISPISRRCNAPSRTEFPQCSRIRRRCACHAGKAKKKALLKQTKNLISLGG
jgi:hypothetical protein